MQKRRNGKRWILITDLSKVRYALPFAIILMGLFNPVLLKADPLSDALKEINAGNYIEASAILGKVLKKDSIDHGGLYLNALLFTKRDNPQYNLDSARFFIDRAQKNIPTDLSEKQMKRYAYLGIREFTISELASKIEQDSYNLADSLNTVAAWEHFLQAYPKAAKFSLAIERRNQLAYEAAQNTATYESFKQFMEKYPNAAQVPEAEKLYESLLYKQLTADGRWQSYSAFAEKHPESPYAEEAKIKADKLQYEEVTKDGRIESYARFANTYPFSDYADEAQDKVFELATINKEVDSYASFIKQYPTNKHIDKAWELLYQLATIKQDSAAYIAFSEAYPSFPLRQMLKEDLRRAGMLLMVFEENGLYGYKDSLTDEIVIPATFSDAFPFSEGYAAVSINPCEDDCKYGYINRRGKLVIDTLYDEADLFHNGLAIVMKGNCGETSTTCKWGFINVHGEIVVPMEYDDAFIFSNGLAMVRKHDEGYGYVNSTGKVVIPLQFNDATSFSEGLAAVKQDSLWGFIDTLGNMVIPFTFKKAGPFGQGLAPVATKNLWGYIDITGKIVLPEKHEFANPFKNGIAKVLVKEKDKKKKTFVTLEKTIDLTGKVVNY
ncbi:MAG: WG repeat-containing protein [Chitinophagales bacterium]|nr:WG repeat-containing protein [Chitinophagales bacterium]